MYALTASLGTILKVDRQYDSLYGQNLPNVQEPVEDHMSSYLTQNKTGK